MVATAGAGWRLASSLDALIDETDQLYPNRDHASDGSIGDADHGARASDHNPDDGWVCAVDIDEDLSSQIHTLARLADHLVEDRDHRVKYLIYEGRICKAYIDSAGHPAWRWYPYTGINSHAHHLHVSIWNTSAARDDRGPWWPEPVIPKPPATTHLEVDDVFTATNSKGFKWFFEEGRRTLIPAPDRDNFSRIPDLGAVTDPFFEDLCKDRKVYQ